MTSSLAEYDGVDGSGLEYMRCCHEPGCDQPSLPEMQMRRIGIDDKRQVVWGRVWHCASGHHYVIPDGWPNDNDV